MKGRIACETVVNGRGSPYVTTLNLEERPAGPVLMFNPGAMNDPGQMNIDDVLPINRAAGGGTT